MVIIQVIQIIMLLICCSIAAYSDLKTGKISNRLVLLFLVISIAGDLFCFFLFGRQFSQMFIPNACSVILISFVLYASHILAGGDCKLLFVVSLMYPVGYYWKIEGSSITLWYIFGPMFMFGFIYLLFETLIYQKHNSERGLWRTIQKELLVAILAYLRTIIYIAALSHIYFYFVYPVFRCPNILYACVCLGCVWWMGRYQIFRSKVLLFSLLIFDMIMSLFTGITTVSTLWETYAIVLTFMILRVIINQYNYQTIPTKSVEAGMIISRLSSMLFLQSRVKGLPEVSDETLRSRITESEAASIRRWEKSKYGCTEITTSLLAPIPPSIRVFPMSQLFA